MNYEFKGLEIEEKKPEKKEEKLWVKLLRYFAVGIMTGITFFMLAKILSVFE